MASQREGQEGSHRALNATLKGPDLLQVGGSGRNLQGLQGEVTGAGLGLSAMGKAGWRLGGQV